MARPGATGTVDPVAAGATAGDVPADPEVDGDGPPLGDEMRDCWADFGVESCPEPFAPGVDTGPAAAEELGVEMAAELPVAVEVLEQPATATAHMTIAAAIVA